MGFNRERSRWVGKGIGGVLWGVLGEIGKGFLVEVRDEFEKRFVSGGRWGWWRGVEGGNAGKDFRG